MIMQIKSAKILFYKKTEHGLFSLLSFLCFKIPLPEIIRFFQDSGVTTNVF